MLWKVVIIFLCAMVLVGMIGKLVFPQSRTTRKKARPAVCARCSRPLIGKQACDCQRG